MPGICGIATRGLHGNGRDVLAQQLAEMLQRLKHHAWYKTHAHADSAAGIALGRTALGFVNSGPQPAESQDGQLMAVMEGELYDAADKLHREPGELKDPIDPRENHARLLLDGCAERGSAFLRRLHGSFAAAIWDKRRGRLHLVNDRFGMKPLYYAHLPGRLLFASEIKALLADGDVARTVNLRGVAQFFSYGQLLGEDTLLDAVRVVPASAWLTYEPATDRLTIQRYREDVIPDGSRWSEAEHLDRIDHAFQRAVDRRVEGVSRLGLSLSGGLDSRTILAAVAPDRALTCVSMGVTGSMDHACAAEMAQLTGRPHHACLLSTDFLAQFETHLRRMVQLTDGHYLSQCVVMPTLPVYRELGVEVLLRGHAGELMHMNKAYNFSLDPEARNLPDASALESWLFRHLQAYMLDGVEGPLLASAGRDEVADLARASLRACLQEHQATRPLLHQVWQLFISQRLRRETALSLAKFGSVVETRLPYLDNDLVDALLAAPPELKWSDRLQAHILRQRMPSFLNVVNANTGARMGAGRFATWLARTRMRVCSKLRIRGYQPYERLGLWLRRELRPLVTRLLLGEQCLGRGLFNADTVRSVVQNHFSKRRNHTFLLMALMIFELGQQMYIDRPREMHTERRPMSPERSPVAAKS